MHMKIFKFIFSTKSISNHAGELAKILSECFPFPKLMIPGRPLFEFICMYLIVEFEEIL